jgi:hypothetical protein
MLTLRTPHTIILFASRQVCALDRFYSLHPSDCNRQAAEENKTLKDLSWPRGIVVVA